MKRYNTKPKRLKNTDTWFVESGMINNKDKKILKKVYYGTEERCWEYFDNSNQSHAE